MIHLILVVLASGMPSYAESLLSQLDTAPTIPSVSLQILSTEQKAKVEALGQKSILEQAEQIKKDIDVELLSTSRKGGSHSFDFLGKPIRSVEEITDIEGLYGKAICQSGQTKAKIVIAEDAPPFTLLHEYIHFLQMKSEKRWCELEGRILESDERKERALMYHRFEFEVLKTLWDFKNKFLLTFEDRLILVEGLNRENKVFESLKVKALDDQTSAQVEKEVEEARGQVHFLTWLTHPREDAIVILQKMEVVALKACTESTKGEDRIKKINDCIQKRCSYTGLSKTEEKPVHSCKTVTAEELKKAIDDIYSQIIISWLKPELTEDCPLSRFKTELTDDIETATRCWKESVASQNKPTHNLKPRILVQKNIRKRFGAPKLAIDKKIAFYEIVNAESFINTAYCYFIFQKVARFESLPIDQFAYATQGASLSLVQKGEYVNWLDKSSQGKTCSKLVKVFSGAEPSRLEGLGKGMKYILLINPIASLTGGLTELASTIRTDVNHERLHIMYADDKSLAARVRTEWIALTEDEKEDFKKKHPSYDFKDEQILFREYFSYSRQEHPQKLF